MYVHNSTVSDIQGKRIGHTVGDRMDRIRSVLPRHQDINAGADDSKIWISESVSTSSHFIPSLPTVPKVSQIQLQVRLRQHRGLSTRTRIWEGVPLHLIDLPSHVSNYV